MPGVYLIFNYVAYFSSIGGRRGEHWSHKRCP